MPTLAAPCVTVVDRATRMPFQEDIWGEGSLRFLYGDSWLSKTLGWFFLHAFVRWPIVSWGVGKWYDSHWSCRAIRPFCERFRIDMEESVLRLEEFTSFNDFFTRRLRAECRPQAPGDDVITMPADGRYRVLRDIENSDLFSLKGEKYSLTTLLGSKERASPFHGGTAVLCRLCPADCHRFFFPMEGKVCDTIRIYGSLFSVSPIATKSRPWIFWSNRRAVTLLETKNAGSIAIVEIGATNCGSIIQTYPANSWVRKGQEKGFFRIGGSALLLLFEPGRVAIEKDLLELSGSGYEMLCRTGQPLATICL